MQCCGKGPRLNGLGGQKRVGVIPNSRFLTGVGRSTRGRSVLFWDDGASWAIGQGPGSYLRRLAGRAAHRRRYCLFPVRVAGVVAGIAFQRTGTRAGPGRGPTVRDSKDRQVPRLDLGLDWTGLD